MYAFHASWFGFFATFFSTFAPAPLAPVLKKSTTLGLKRTELAMGNLMSVTSNIICRFLMGIVCDKMGARKGLAFVLLITAPAIFGMMFVTNAAGFIACRFVIGMGLASFVACQVWCTQMFSKRIVGVANATAGGWGNLGGGVTLFAMGQIFLAFMAATGENEDLSCAAPQARRDPGHRPGAIQLQPCCVPVGVASLLVPPVGALRRRRHSPFAFRRPPYPIPPPLLRHTHALSPPSLPAGGASASSSRSSSTYSVPTLRSAARTCPTATTRPSRSRAPSRRVTQAS